MRAGDDRRHGSAAAVVLAGGRSRRFGGDKLEAGSGGLTLLDRTLIGLPEELAIIVVGPERPTFRPVAFAREDPPGGGPAAGLIAGLRAALAAGADEIAVLPADAPGAGEGARAMLARLRSDAQVGAVVAVDADGRDQPLQLAVAAGRARALLAAVGPAGGAGRSARSLLSALEPLLRQSLPPAQLWDVDTRDQLLAWELHATPAVDEIAQAVAARAAARGSAGSAAAVRMDAGAVVVAVDGPSSAGKSTLSAALRLRLDATVVEVDDFCRAELRRTDPAARDALSAEQVADAAVDWERLRTQALEPLRSGRSATFIPSNPSSDDGRPAAAKSLEPAAVVVVDGVFSARPEMRDLVDVAVYLGAADREAPDRNDRAPGCRAEWVRFRSRGEAYYFARVRPPETFDIVLAPLH